MYYNPNNATRYEDLASMDAHLLSPTGYVDNAGVFHDGGSAYSPIPLNGDNSFRIAQQDGSENVIHIGENSFYMESSNCKNQNCVGQGEVTLENRESRPLFNMVICLPHNLSLELLTREEAEARLLEMYAKDPPPAA